MDGQVQAGEAVMIAPPSDCPATCNGVDRNLQRYHRKAPMVEPTRVKRKLAVILTIEAQIFNQQIDFSHTMNTVVDTGH